MPPIMLPRPTRETEVTVREISWSKDITPTGPGVGQRVEKMGTRHAMRFSIPVLRYAWCGAGLAADLALGRSGDGAAMIIPEPGIDQSIYGNPTVLGSNQIGSSINATGFTPNVTIRKGKWFNLIVNGRYYAYFTTSEVTAAPNGSAELDLYPMIRRSALTGSQIRIADPLIQGLIAEPNQRKIGRLAAKAIGLDFEIVEQE